MKAYIISGLGANAKAFDKIEFPHNVKKIFLPWIIPNRNEKINEYAKRLSENIDDKEPFFLIGLSFGGIVAQEIHQHKKAEKIIIISSIKSENEKPEYMRFSERTKLHKLIPTFFLTSDTIISYSFFRKLHKPKMQDIKSIFEYRNAYYLRWSINNIVNWKPSWNTLSNLHHIHGDKDKVFPLKYIKNPITITNGTHIMIMQKHKKISQIISEIFNQYKQ